MANIRLTAARAGESNATASIKSSLSAAANSDLESFFFTFSLSFLAFSYFVIGFLLTAGSGAFTGTTSFGLTFGTGGGCYTL